MRGLKRTDTGARLVVPNEFKITPTSSKTGTPVSSEKSANSPIPRGKSGKDLRPQEGRRIFKSISDESIELPSIFSRQDTNTISLVPADFSIEKQEKKKKKKGKRREAVIEVIKSLIIFNRN